MSYVLSNHLFTKRKHTLSSAYSFAMAGYPRYHEDIATAYRE
jgi:hypothetical protein